MLERGEVFSGALGIIWTLGLLALVSVLSVAWTCSRRTPTPDEILSEAQAVLENLNRWDKVELDIAESPEKYPGRIASGETHGWILTHQHQLKQLGFVARWNRERRIYEIHKHSQRE